MRGRGGFGEMGVVSGRGRGFRRRGVASWRGWGLWGSDLRGGWGFGEVGVVYWKGVALRGGVVALRGRGFWVAVGACGGLGSMGVDGAFGKWEGLLGGRGALREGVWLLGKGGVTGWGRGLWGWGEREVGEGSGRGEELLAGGGA